MYKLVPAEVFHLHHGIGNCGRSNPFSVQRCCPNFFPRFIPQSAVDETLKHLPSALNEQCLNVAAVELQEQRVNVCEGFKTFGEFCGRDVAKHTAQRGWTVPSAGRQRRFVEQQGAMPHENGLMRGAQAVAAELCFGRRNQQGLLRRICSAGIDKSIRCARPLQGNVGALVGVKRKEVAVERLTFRLAHAYNDFTTRVA